MARYFAFLILLIVASTQALPHRNGFNSPRIPTGSQTRIVGGVEVDRQDYPYVMSVEWLGYYPFCGASYVGSVGGKTFFITACHCIEYDVPEEISVVAKNKTTDSAKGQRFQMSAIYVNPEWNSDTLEYDTCILESMDAVEDGFMVSHIPLCEEHDIEVGKMATVLGWGATSESGSQSTALQMVQVPLLSNSECNGKYSSLGWDVTESMICAGYTEGGKDSCQGDSGGPIVTDKKAAGSGSCLIGTVSWGYGCARPNYPGVYGYALACKNWIDQIMTPSATTTTSTSTTTTTTQVPTTTTTTTTQVPTTTTESTSTSRDTPEPNETTTEKVTHETNEPSMDSTTGHDHHDHDEEEDESLWDSHRTIVIICSVLVGILALAIPIALCVAISKKEKLTTFHACALTVPLAIAILLALTLGITWVMH